MTIAVPNPGIKLINDVTKNSKNKLIELVKRLRVVGNLIFNKHPHSLDYLKMCLIKGLINNEGHWQRAFL